jgi:putative NIF3 family GTP cyclohydrolase 1 type 2
MVVCGVTASQAAGCAVARGADAVLVHHGYFWRGEDGCITGLRGSGWRPLANDINLFAYHLPLDAHPSSATTPSWPADGLSRKGDSASRTSAGRALAAAGHARRVGLRPRPGWGASL